MFFNEGVLFLVFLFLSYFWHMGTRELQEQQANHDVSNARKSKAWFGTKTNCEFIIVKKQDNSKACHVVLPNPSIKI